MNIRGISDVYGVGELEATGSALIEAHETGTILATGSRCALLTVSGARMPKTGDKRLSLRG